MRPGISRATIGGLLFFLAGSLIVVALRIAFNFTPYWNLGLGIILSAFMSAWGVMWGIGAFDPRMSEHGAPSLTIEEEAAQAGPFSLLTSAMWQITAASTVLVLVFIGIAALPFGPGLEISSEAEAAVNAAGTVTLNAFGGEIVVNQIMLFFAWTLFTVLSLAISGGALAWITWKGHEQVVEANNTPVPEPGSLPEGGPNRFQKAIGGGAKALADAIRPAENTETTAVVAAEAKDAD